LDKAIEELNGKSNINDEKPVIQDSKKDKKVEKKY
jgi:hypothetical protein